MLKRLPTLTTERLILRDWLPEDGALFAQMNADPRVMEFMPGVMTREQSDQMRARLAEHGARYGFGLWAVEHRETAAFMGYVGLLIPSFDPPFQCMQTPCVEIGWRLAAEYWGQGVATEGAREVLRHGFLGLGLLEIVSFTVPDNTRSRRVMEKLGMTHDPADDFAHPTLAPDHRLSRHVLYRMSAHHFSR